MKLFSTFLHFGLVQGCGVLQDACVNQTTHPQMNTTNEIKIRTITRKQWKRQDSKLKSWSNGNRFTLLFNDEGKLELFQVVVIK